MRLDPAGGENAMLPLLRRQARQGAPVRERARAVLPAVRRKQGHGVGAGGAVPHVPA